MQTLELTILGRPASKKNSRRNYGHISLPSEAFLRFKEDALWQLKKHKPKNIIQKCQIEYTFYQKGKLTQDPDNAIASINDVLQDAEIIADDSLIFRGYWVMVREAKAWVTKIKITYHS